MLALQPLGHATSKQVQRNLYLADTPGTLTSTQLINTGCRLKKGSNTLCNNGW